MHFIKWGTGNTDVVCLHGWPGDSTKWAELSSYLDNQNLSIWSLDLPGWGKSSLDQVFTLKDYANYLKKFLEKHNILNPILIGHSFGGRVAIKYVNIYPEDINKIILISSAGIVDQSLHEQLRIKFSELLPSFIKNNLHPWLGSYDYRQANKHKRQTFNNIVTEDLRALISSINCPTLLLWGDEDHTTPIKHAKVFNALIKKSQLIIVSGDHGLPYRKAEEIAPLINKFINE